MNQMRKLLIVFYGLFIAGFFLSFVFSERSTGVDVLCSGFLILVYAGLLIVSYRYAKYESKNPIPYVIGSVFFAAIVPGILLYQTRSNVSKETVYESDSAEPSGPVTLDTRFYKLKMSNNYNNAMKGLKTAAIGSMIFGFLAAVSGPTIEGVLGVVAFVAGILLIAEGIWILIARREDWLIFECFALVIIGLLNILITVQDLVSGTSGGQSTGFFLTIGVVQIVMGWKSIGKYQYFSGQAMMKPTASIQKEIKKHVNAIAGGIISDNSELIEFSTQDILSGNNTWKAKLSGNSSIFVMGNAKEVYFEKKSFVLITLESGIQPDTDNPAKISIGSNEYRGLIEQMSFERYKAWKDVQYSPKEELFPV